MRLRVKTENHSIEVLCFEWLKQETGDHDRAASLCAGGYVEAALELNPGLAELQVANGDSLPIGTVLALPPLPDDTIVQTVKLWD